jgi:hypothetical protein
VAKVNISTSGLIATIKTAFKNIGSDNGLYAQILNFSVERIKQTSRRSKRMETDGGEESLPTLSKGYQKQRSKLSPGQKGTDPTFFRPETKKSNVTYTGQLLNSVTGKIEKQGPDVGKMSIEFEGTRKDGITNDEVYKRLLARNPEYKILALNKKATQNIRSIVLTKLRQELKKLRLTK